MPELGDLISFDKLAHLAVFAILSFLLIVGFKKQFSYLKLRHRAVKSGIVISLIYASFLELGQSLIPGRYANIYDMAFNITGVFVGYLMYLLIYKFSFR